MVPWTPFFQFLLAANVAWAIGFVARRRGWSWHRCAGLALILLPFIHLALQVAVAAPSFQDDVELAPLSEGDIWRNILVAFLYRVALPLAGLALVFEAAWRRALRFLFVPRATWRVDVEDGQALVAAIVLIYVAGYFLVPTLLGEQALQGADAPLSEVGAITAILLSVGAGLGEELLFRGLLQRWLLRHVPWSLAVAGQALVFGLSHATYANLVPVVGSTALGLLAGLVAARLGLIAAILLHAQLDLLHFALDLQEPLLLVLAALGCLAGSIILVYCRARPLRTLLAPLPNWRQRADPDAAL